MSALPVPFSFQDIALAESVWIEGKPYFTRRAIGEFLEYAEPQKAIDKIIERNPAIQEFATTVNLTAVEGTRRVQRKIQVFDPVAFQLVVFRSNQPRAMQFQVAVAHRVLAYMRGELRPAQPPVTLQGLAALPPRTKLAGNAVRALAAVTTKFKPNGAIGASEATVRRRVKRIRNQQPLNLAEPGRMIFVHKKYRTAFKLFGELFLVDPRTAVSQIRRLSGVSESTAYEWRLKLLKGRGAA